MKKIIPFLIITFLLGLCACSSSPKANTTAEQTDGALAGNSLTDNSYTAYEPSAALEPSAQETADTHSHTAFNGNNIIEHEFAVYCGNTRTRISLANTEGGEPISLSFWGEDSVALTDLLRYLDYNEDVCKCVPEYHVDTDFNFDGGYDISLTGHYARCNGRQVNLTQEQVDLIYEIWERNCENQPVCYNMLH